MALVMSPAILAKIGADDHGNVTQKDIEECFANHCGGYCYDNRKQHLDKSGNPAIWFVGETNDCRPLKISFVRENGNIYLKSAYPASPKIQAMYRKYAA